LEAAILTLRFQHHHRRRRRQILKLHVDREAFTSDLGDDRLGAGFFFWRFKKQQHVVLAVLHNNSDASRPAQ
jgi:hypothetical protein